MKPERKMPRQYTMSEAALRVRRKAAKVSRGGRTKFQVVNIPKALMASLDGMKGKNEPYWRFIVRTSKAFEALHAIREKLLSQGDPEIRELVKFLEEHGDGDDGSEA